MADFLGKLIGGKLWKKIFITTKTLYNSSLYGNIELVWSDDYNNVKSKDLVSNRPCFCHLWVAFDQWQT